MKSPIEIIREEDEKEISDREWKEFLKENYSHVKYGIPDKHTTSLFLKWRNSKQG